MLAASSPSPSLDMARSYSADGHRVQLRAPLGGSITHQFRKLRTSCTLPAGRGTFPRRLCPLTRLGRRIGGVTRNGVGLLHAWSGRDAAGTAARHRRARCHMQVQCTKCSRPIALTDIIESSDGRLSHVECDRPQTLTPEERSLIFTYCSGHAVTQCLSCNRQYRFEELAAGLFRRHTNMCPRCGTDLTENVRAHLFRCAMLPAEVR